MGILKKISNPFAVLVFILEKTGIFVWLSDKSHIKLLFRRTMGYKLNLDNTLTFNEKLQWLKLYDRNPFYAKIADKYEVKNYVRNLLGEEFVIPTLGIWERFGDIDFSQLPKQFVLKCTHDSGSVIVCEDKTKFDIISAKKKLERALNKNPYYVGREFQYKYIIPKIIAEQYITDSMDTCGLTDYKFFCFNGYVHCVMICIDRFKGHPRFYFFNKNWELLLLNKTGRNESQNISLNKPDKIDEMYQIASKLSLGIPFVRIDLYYSDGRILFGESTLYPAGGFDSELFPETDLMFGNLIDLNIVKH